MVKFLRNYCFFIFLGVLVLFFIVFITVIIVAPHNDARMRGFAPCTYQIAEKLMVNENIKQSEVFKIIVKGYGCYFKVMKNGAVLFFKGQQITPWANYMFKPEENTMETEIFDENLEENSLLSEDEETGDILDNLIKENTNE